MLPYMIATIPHFLPVVTVPALVLRLSISDYQARSASLLFSVNADITLGCPAANTSGTKDMMMHCLPRSEVHSIHNYHNFPFFVWLVFLLIQAIQQSTHALIRANFISYTTSSPLSSRTQLTLTSSSSHPRRLTPQYLPTFLSLLRSSASMRM